MKKKTSPKSISAYIKRQPKEVQKLLKAMRKTIKKAAPKAKETISYAIPTFTLKGNLVHFAAMKKHIGFYPGGRSPIRAFKDQLKKYKTSAGTIQIPFEKKLPLGLISKITKFRVRENTIKKALKKTKKKR